MLVWLLVFASNQLLRELVHEVGCHPDNFGLVKLILDLREVYVVILIDIPSKIVILVLEHGVQSGIHVCGLLFLLVQLLVLRELVTLLYLGFLQQHSRQHHLFVEVCLYLFSLDCKKTLRERIHVIGVLNDLPLELVKRVKH